MSTQRPVPEGRSAFEQRWRERFQSFARAGRDDAAIAGWSTTGLEARMRKFVSLWHDERQGALWLDAGCGAGTYSRFLLGRGLRVVAMDYSGPTIHKARDRGGDTIMWCIGDVGRLPVPAAAFDGAMCFGVVQALSDSAAAVRELARAVKPGATVWIDALNPWCLPSLWDRVKRKLSGRPPHLRYESDRTLRRLMTENGLTGARLDWLPILPAGWQRFQWLVESAAGRFLFRCVPLAGLVFSHAYIVRARRAADGAQGA